MSLLAPGRSLVLIGSTGAGKTTVGRLLAQRLARSFVDTDGLVVHDAGRSVAEIFAEEGERGFRRREAEAIRAVSTLRGRVIAVGGGALEDPSNVTALRATGEMVLLEAEPATVALRLAGDTSRPLLAGGAGGTPATPGGDDTEGAIAALLSRRRAAYRAAAAAVVATDDRTPEEVVALVLEWARTRHGVLTEEERAA